MRASIEVFDGNSSWPLAEALDRACYPPEILANVVWRDVTWAHADKRIFVFCESEPVCHVGIFFRAAHDGEKIVRIGGVGGVMTSPDMRKQGLAGAAMQAAADLLRDAKCDFGLLFCEPHNVAFYEGLGWSVFGGDVFCEQPMGRIRFDMMHTMVLPVLSSPGAAVIDLCGLPW